ncbi:putative oxygenase MesX [Leucobacter sp. USHLN153]|uniref:putative oxygenase MesX n=1 Tax=Leucobacter sp. USHLN153 TaxID=3081268 RepID=UPI00301943B1
MDTDCQFSISTTRFDEHYAPSSTSRTTTNFANLARGVNRQDNLRNAMQMIDRRFNDLVHWDNPARDRYRLELDIVSVELSIDAGTESEAAEFPIIEVLDVAIVDQHTGSRIDGIVGNNFSSYIRDYDFSVRLRQHAEEHPGEPLPEDFGRLHGRVFELFLDSPAYRECFAQLPVICISVSTSRTYQRLTNEHPILGVEYAPEDGSSLTDTYFGSMGLQVRYFMPPGAVAPLAFYYRGDLLGDYTPLALAATVATMESFQKIYRPEIYNANSAAGEIYRPNLEHGDYSPTRVTYDRVERSQLAVQQGRFTEEHLMRPYGDVLERWAAQHSDRLIDA